jgi:hypothetical protein
VGFLLRQRGTVERLTPSPNITWIHNSRTLLRVNILSKASAPFIHKKHKSSKINHTEYRLCKNSCYPYQKDFFRISRIKIADRKNYTEEKYGNENIKQEIDQP